MYQGSAAGVLVERGFCSNPPQKPQKSDYIHLVHVLLRRHSMWKVVLLEGCSIRVLGDILHKTAVLGAMSGSRAEDTHAAAPSAVGEQKMETWLGQQTQNYCHKRDISLS